VFVCVCMCVCVCVRACVCECGAWSNTMCVCVECVELGVILCVWSVHYETASFLAHSWISQTLNQVSMASTPHTC